MEKAFYICNGNKVVDIILGNGRERQAQIALDLYNRKYSDCWINYNIVELEAEGKINKGSNNLHTLLLNGEPHKAFLNESRNKALEFENDEYRKYTYLTHSIMV